MHIRYLALAAAAFALLACSTAFAAPTTVQLRIEGTTRTVYEGPITTDGKTITKGADTVVCDGTVNPGNATPGPTPTSALDDAALQTGVTWDATFFAPDFFLNRFADQESTAWGYAVNYVSPPLGGCQYQLQPGDDVLWAADFFGGPPDYAQKALLRLDGPAKASVNAPLRVVVTDGTTHAPVAGATVGVASTGTDGGANVALGTPGVVSLKAEAPGAIRSNALTVCVSQDGTADCGLPAPVAAVKDSAAPRARISGPRDGRHFRSGPRLLSGTAADNVGVTKVKLALRRHEHGKPCHWWSSTSERFAGRGCRTKVFFGIDGAGKWSYLLPRNLPPGRYVLDVKAFDRARNRDEHFVRGSNRVVFYVGRGYRARSATASRQKAARVRVLLAGRSKSRRAVVRARATHLKVGGHTCKVGASTPLAALAAVLRERGTGYVIRDYGSCSATNAAAAGQLFVRRIGKDSNHGNDGWFYKVNDRAPEIGSGDLAARLGTGDRLLWFYCVFDEAARSCQRSLRIFPGGGTAGVNVKVRGYDNAGHSVPVGGATVATGSLTATSTANGGASLAASGPGHYRVTAVKAGMVDAFPVTMTVK
jgi:hypothetical protein